MAIFTMSDLHLSLDTDKSMEVFGALWNDYINRIRENWLSLVSDEDTVLIGGDISWAMHLCDCKKDFEFINSLPGKKLLFKGNHDYWRESLTKMNNFLCENEFSTLSFVNNNAVICEDTLIAGTRGWTLPGDSGFGSDDEKIYQRELLRLELSLKHGEEICKESDFVPSKRVCILHYPPFTKEHVLDEAISTILKSYAVTDCFYGHLHSQSAQNAAEGMYDGVNYRLVSADYLEFVPFKI